MQKGIFKVFLLKAIKFKVKKNVASNATPFLTVDMSASKKVHKLNF